MPAITNEERERRREAIEFARTSVELSGFSANSPDEIARDERFINGELTLDEYIDTSDIKPLGQQPKRRATYFSENRQKSLPAITEEEQREARRAGIELARASVALSGLPVNDPDEIARDERYINGEMTLDEFVDRSDIELSIDRPSKEHIVE